MSEITPAYLPDRNRYALDDNGKLIGAAHYRDFQGVDGVERIFFHTVVDEEYGGQGLASVMVKFALDNTISGGAKIVAVCPYVKAYIAKHPEFQEHLAATTDEHLKVLPSA